MKITPLDIRQKTFTRKTFGGVNSEEVNAFLHSLSVAWERVLDENKELRIRLEATERELGKLREVESSLYRTLKTAEDTSQNLIDQARSNADIKMRDAQLKAESIMKEAKWQAKNVIEDAEGEARKVYKTLHTEVKNLEGEYRQIEHMRDNLLADLKALSNEIQDKADRAAMKANKVHFLAPSPKPATPELEAIKRSLTEPEFANFKPEPEDPATTLEAVHTETGPVFQSPEPEPEPAPSNTWEEPAANAYARSYIEPEPAMEHEVEETPAFKQEPEKPTFKAGEPQFSRRAQGSFFDQF